MNQAWIEGNLVGISILQETGSKAVVQAATSKNQVFTKTENILEAPFSLYAAGNKVFFQADEVGQYQVQVFDLQGKMLKELNSNGQDELTFDNLITGAYLVRIQQEGKVWAKLLPIAN